MNKHPAFAYDEETLATALEENSLTAQFNHFTETSGEVTITFRESIRYAENPEDDSTVWDADVLLAGTKIFNVKMPTVAELLAKLEATAKVARKVSDEERIQLVEGADVIIGRVIYRASRL